MTRRQTPVEHDEDLTQVVTGHGPCAYGGEVLSHEPMRQSVLSVLFPLRFLFASRPVIMGKMWQ